MKTCALDLATILLLAFMCNGDLLDRSCDNLAFDKAMYGGCCFRQEKLQRSLRQLIGQCMKMVCCLRQENLQQRLACQILRQSFFLPLACSVFTAMANYRLHYDDGNPAELWWQWCRCNVATSNYNTLLSIQSVVVCSNLLSLIRFIVFNV